MTSDRFPPPFPRLGATAGVIFPATLVVAFALHFVGEFGPRDLLTLKLRYGDFTTLTRQITVEEPVSDPARIYRLACFLLGREKLVSRPLRLLGLGVSHLDSPQARQLVFWPEENQRSNGTKG